MNKDIPTPVCPISGQLAFRVCITPSCDANPFICKQCAHDQCFTAHEHGGNAKSRNWEVVADSLAKRNSQPREEAAPEVDEVRAAFESIERCLERLQKGFAQKVEAVKSNQGRQDERVSLLQDLMKKNYARFTGEAMRTLIDSSHSEREERRRQEAAREIKDICKEYLRLTQEIEGTIKAFTKSTEEARKSCELRRQALKHLRENHIDLAERCLSESIQISPNDYESLEERARLHFNSKHLEEALKDAERAIGLEPHRPVSRFIKGCILFQRKEFAQAYREFTVAIHYESKPAYFERRGSCSFEMRQYERALSDYTDVLKLRETPWDLLNEGAAYSMLNLRELSERDIELAFKKLDESPNSAEIEPYESYAFNRLEEAKKVDLQPNGCRMRE